MPRATAIAALGLITVATAPPSAAADRCHRSHALGEALNAQIRAKLRFLNNPRQYCLVEKRQLQAAKAFRDYVANDKDCFQSEQKRLHALQLVQVTVASASQDVAEDCR